MMYIKALGGLANKLRAIESALSLAKDLNQKLTVEWVMDWQMVARFDELFQPTDLFTITYANQFSKARSVGQIAAWKKQIAATVNFFYRIDLFLNDIDLAPKGIRINKQLLLAKTKAKKKIVISTCHDFYHYHFNFSWAKPIVAIQYKIDLLKNNFGHYMVGIHIRRTDNAASIENSPLYLFETQMNEILIQQNDAIFFLATDDQPTEIALVEKFGAQKIITHKKQFGRAAVVAIQDAVVDWVCLGHTQQLLCSYHSSFSETAATKANIPYTVIKKETI